MKTCIAESCERPQRYSTGYCVRHDYQYKKYGKIISRTRYDRNEITEYADHAEISLYDGDGAEIGRAKIDLEDIELARSNKWTLLVKSGYVMNSAGKYLHRLVMNAAHGQIVDHIRVGKDARSDNRKQNLRFVTHRQNSIHRKMHENNSSGMKGVFRRRGRDKWTAVVGFDGKLRWLGNFSTRALAAEAYAIEAARLHGSDYVVPYADGAT